MVSATVLIAAAAHAAAVTGASVRQINSPDGQSSTVVIPARQKEVRSLDDDPIPGVDGHAAALQFDKYAARMQNRTRRGAVNETNVNRNITISRRSNIVQPSGFGAGSSSDAQDHDAYFEDTQTTVASIGFVVGTAMGVYLVSQKGSTLDRWMDSLQIAGLPC
eukprot:comp16115_c0_seq1/m.13668 comp16115_c0_seq1/g.13668  ORF comp16115_c0_seq1/g.13668 comp16115_c0_seq1/m.13668 type:complete len:163 (-) comp16115_c0_seq1:422-910(-)